MSTSAFDIITRAMRLDGVIASLDTPDSQDTNDAFVSLNMMLEQWSLEDLMCYQYTNSTFNSVAETASYTIGASGATWTATRPIRITSGWCRVGTIDYGLQIMSNDEYQGISMKTLQSVPRGLYYSPEYPLGKIYLYPVPNIVYPIGISCETALIAFTGLETAISLPPGYLKALIYNLAVEIAPEYGKQIDPLVMKKAIDTKAAIKRINSKQPELSLEQVYLGHGVTALGGTNGRFNIYSGF
jgi:hypothetical protein